MRPRKLTPIEEGMVYELYKQGVDLATIAYKNKISVSTVQRIIKRTKEYLNETNE